MQHLNKIDTVCFTGHRKITASHAPYIPTLLKKYITSLIERGAVHFRAGGAMGFDTVAALCVLELKEIYPHICLDLILPCRDQTKGWDNYSITTYDYILGCASSSVFLHENYRRGCMHERNRALVNGSQVCIAYMEKRSGGTFFTYKYAMDNGLEVINVFEGLELPKHEF